MAHPAIEHTVLGLSYTVEENSKMYRIVQWKGDTGWRGVLLAVGMEYSINPIKGGTENTFNTSQHFF